MSEENGKTETVAVTEAAEQPKVEEPKKSTKDEKGLTLLGRTVLRATVEFRRCMQAQMVMGKEASVQKCFKDGVLQQEIKNIIIMGVAMIERMNLSPGETMTYLGSHFDEDLNLLMKATEDIKPEHRQQVSQEMGNKSAPTEVLDLLSKILSSKTSRCGKCNKPMCSDCGSCHHCGTTKTSAPN